MVLLVITVDISVVILLVVLGSCEISRRNSFYGISIYDGKERVVNIVLFFVFVEAV